LNRCMGCSEEARVAVVVTVAVFVAVAEGSEVRVAEGVTVAEGSGVRVEEDVAVGEGLRTVAVYSVPVRVGTVNEGVTVREGTRVAVEVGAIVAEGFTVHVDTGLICAAAAGVGILISARANANHTPAAIRNRRIKTRSSQRSVDDCLRVVTGSARNEAGIAFADLAAYSSHCT